MTDLVRETKVLFLTIRAINKRSWSPVLYESLGFLCRSDNAAICNQGHMLIASLTQEDELHAQA
jgi:hypothetical protein